MRSLVICLLLAGCGTTYVKPGTSSFDEYYDLHYCQTNGQKPEVVRQCMREKGWAVK